MRIPAGPGLLLLAVAACSSAGRATPDASPPADAPAPIEAAPAATCGGVACGGDHFCSATGKCISAVQAVAAGTVHTCALHRDGTVSCWGLGAFIGPNLPSLTPPVPIALPGRATALAVGIQAACALLESGQVSCWGDRGQGPEGAAAVVKEDGSPLGAVTGIAGGSVAFCATGPQATHCWGENKASELARPASMTFPPLTAVMVVPGPRPLMAATVAILVYDGAGQLCGWGNNDSAIVPGARGILEQPTCAPQAIPGILQLSAGDGHACARRGGSAFSCWGSNAGGQLGNGDDLMNDVPLPGSMQALPAEVESIAAGAYHTCALVKGGAIWCWGSNQQGECGQPSSAPIVSPTEVPGVRAVAIGSGAGAQHTCVVLAHGGVACWGSDLDGQLGSGATKEDDTRFSATPVVVRW